ncbi:hypothetical protein METBIDRAFT_30817 [Metschnikowia bicuspidata var. bicuspidata NRRL YB-4993]|uniref:tRNA ligase n=1 Tax=Metschnikowia bicuspidata var. bicuspidata NRRL YB-4993 TaxID=869754 RepID=A0A1A0HCY6_9ASCO|nr:hypothetical protein METBIDRAFT_30817 [Metschnikowia bicuspidata var. bicuspidata NRRL YB-4993]OBA21793.1 hypothetical protein METBIDRAFT_30817 [Metschnikowia bicuspidata var. bicuspidata NRRL YB-4993]
MTGDLDTETYKSQGKHYKKGIEAIHKQLAAIGKTPEELARVLYEQKVTAVAELCDDEFEEHILEYPHKIAGLYLHGLNHNEINFSTAAMDRVSEFGKTWGFREVEYTSYATYDELMDFIKSVDQVGTYNGRELEGFVVRCKRKMADLSTWDDYFFKYKYDQPYALYRQLREATLKFYPKDYTRPLADIRSMYPKFRKITFAYLQFAGEYFQKYPERREEFEANIGVIKLRKLFVEDLLADQPTGIKPHQMEANEKIAAKFDRLISTTETVYCVVTMAAPGCGKTTTCMTLANMCADWEHVQNDDFTSGQNVTDKVLELLGSKKLVFFDRMNYRENYRKEFFTKIFLKQDGYIMPNVGIKFIGVNFLNYESPQSKYKLLEERVFARGDNHQSIAAKSSPTAARSVLLDTLKKYQPPKLKEDEEDLALLPRVVEGLRLDRSDSELSLLINLDVEGEDSSLKNARIIYDELTRAYPDLRVKDFSEDEWQSAFAAAKSYQPKTRKRVSAPSRTAIYYGIDVDHDSVVAHLDRVLADNATWLAIKQNGRVQPEFHVTLAHMQAVRNNKAKYQSTWQDLGRLFSKNVYRKSAAPGTRVPVPIYTDMRLEKIVVFEKTLVALKVAVPSLYRMKEDGAKVGHEAAPITNSYLHITVGTVDQSIAPKMSNVHLAALYEKGEVCDGHHQLLNNAADVFSWDHDMEKQQGFIYFD